MDVCPKIITTLSGDGFSLNSASYSTQRLSIGAHACTRDVVAGLGVAAVHYNPSPKEKKSQHFSLSHHLNMCHVKQFARGESEGFDRGEIP